MFEQSLDTRAVDAHGEDLESEDFFELDFSTETLGSDGDEIGAGFDFSTYEKTLRLKLKAKAILGLGLIG